MRCRPGANPFLERWFKDCIYTRKDMAGFVFGMVSILFWVVAQLPQFIINIKNQSAEALSPWFLAEWLLGDTFNLIGCLLNGQQLATQLYTAMCAHTFPYFIGADVCMMIQYIYYQAVQRGKERAFQASRRRLQAHRQQAPHHRHLQHWPDAGAAQALSQAGPVPDQAVDKLGGGPASVQGSAPDSSPAGPSGPAKKYRVVACFALLLVANVPAFLGLPGLGPWDQDPRELSGPGRHLQGSLAGGVLELWHGRLHRRPPWAQTAGTMIGWASSALYLSSRISQLYRNYTRKSAAGLSMAMFLCAMAANLCYGAGVLLRAHRFHDLLSSGPWLLGSLGTVALDFCICWQAVLYRERTPKKDEEAALLSSVGLEHASTMPGPA